MARKSKKKDSVENPKHLTVAIHAPDLSALAEIVRTRPTTAAGRTRFPSLDIRTLFDQVSKERTAKSTIGKGDRFKGGRVPPHGVGSRPDVRDDDIGPMMNSDEINSAIQGLVNEYGIPTLEFGYPMNFYPTLPEYHSNLKDSGAGLM